MISSTTLGSSKVLVSPKLLKSFEAIFLSILLIIFPDLVLGRPFTNWIFSTFAIGPTFFTNKLFISAFVLISSFITPVK